MAKHARSARAIEKSRRGVIYAILVIISIIWIIPFVYLVFQSLSATANPGSFFPLQGQWTGNNYALLFTSNIAPFFRWWLNTFIIALASAVLQTIFVLMTAYALSRLRFKGRQGIMKLILLLGMFPGFLGMVVIYMILKLFGLSGSVFSLIIVYVASSAMSYYIAKGFFDTIPKSLDEAVLIDGGNKNTVFWKVILPMSKPIVIYTVLVSFTGPWGDYMFASLLSQGASDMAQKTVAVGLKTLLTTQASEALPNPYGLFCAGAVFVSIPIMILFFWLQRYYVEGIAGGAVKG